MNMQKYAAYKRAARRLVKLAEEEKKPSMLNRMWNANYGPAQDGSIRWFYNDDPDVRSLPEWSWLGRTVDDPYSDKVPLAPFSRDIPGFRAVYDNNLNMNAQLRRLRAQREAEGRLEPQVPSATTTSNYNGRNGWRDHSWKKWFKDNAKNLVAGLTGNSGK